MQELPKLPIDSIKDQIIDSLRESSNLLIKATPGSGKTTRVPLYLISELAKDKKIYILEPRRLAAKLAALQVARSLDEPIGHTVGYIFRYERVISEKTRIIFLTEGTFLKILSKNKTLSDAAVVILDEFHERHLSTDAALSFIIKLQKEKMPNLKIIVMSATLETENLNQFLGSSGKTQTLELATQRFPLLVNYLPNVTSIVSATLGKKVRNALEEIIQKNLSGDILVFLPGMREIREVKDSIETYCSHYEIECLILHGDLDASEQDHVLKKHEKRKIILSTNIAESSVTIEGIRIVIDSGLQRESSYNFFSGLPELKVTKISKSQAIQRSGRSNREDSGHAFRLYAQLDFEQRPFQHKPEILKSDLSELYLSSLDLFNESIEALPWFENPPLNAVTNARELLFIINALDETGITETGRKILEYPVHPRFGRILVEAQKYNKNSFYKTLTFIAELSGERNTERIKKSIPPYRGQSDKAIDIEYLILKGFPDRIAKARGGHFFDVITQNGENLKIAKEIADSFDPQHDLWAVLDLNNRGEVASLIPIEEIWLYDQEPFIISEETRYEWDSKKERVLKFERTFIGKIILSESRSEPTKQSNEALNILKNQALGFIDELSHSQEFERLMTLNKVSSNNQDLDLNLSRLLDNFFTDRLNFNNEVKEELAYEYFSELKKIIDPENQYNLDIDLPMTISLTDRRKISIIYDRSQSPTIEAYIQDFYGMLKTPLLAKGKIPLTLKLLGPHKLAIQVTQDLESFWTKTYPQMVTGLKRDYPRHYWPDDPKTARPILLKRQVPT